MLERLHKILARAGVAALRPAEDMILAGRVTVNGRVVRELGARADAAADTIAVDGQTITVPTTDDPHRYLVLHKPVGVISTASDPEGRPTVTQLVPDDVRVFPVGRLDADSEGLLLLTDDGELTYRLTHPRFGIEKEYQVLLDKALSVEAMRQWRSGLTLPDGEQTAPAWVEVLDRTDYGDWLRVVLQEGKKREIREVARSLGYDVRRLIRVREGPILLDNLPLGAWRALSADEVEALRRYTQHVPSREADEARESFMSDSERGPRRLRIMRKPQRSGPSLDAATSGTLSPEEPSPPAERPAQAAPSPRPAERPARTRFDGNTSPRDQERGFDLPPAARGNEREEPGRTGPGGPRQRTFDRPPQRPDSRPSDRPYNAQRPDSRPSDRPYNPRRDNGFNGPSSNDRRPPARRDDQQPRFPERGTPPRGFGSRRDEGGNSFGNRQGSQGGDGRSGPPAGAQRQFGRRDDQQPRGFGGPSNGPRREGGYAERRPNGPPQVQGQEDRPSRGIRDFSNRSPYSSRGPARGDGSGPSRSGGYNSRPPQRPDDRRNDGGPSRFGGYGSRPPQRSDDRRPDDRPNRNEAERGNTDRPDERPRGFGDRSGAPRSGGSPRFGGSPRGGGSGSRFGGSSRGGSGGRSFGGGGSGTGSGPSRSSSGPRRRKND